jgi:hypothetical protein
VFDVARTWAGRRTSRLLQRNTPMSTSAKTFAAFAVALFAISSVSVPADARPKHRSLKSSTGARLYDRPDQNGWYPRVADQLKVGSAIWFEQMEREGRFGGSRRTR